MAKLGKNPFKLYEAMAEFYYGEGYQHKNRKKEEQYRILLKFATAMDLDEEDVIEVLEKDLRETFNPEEVKRFMKKGWEI